MRTVSVIIPSYNRESYIAEAVESVLEQKLPRGWQLEVIVADDGSTDQTVKIAKKFGSKITLLELPHAGRPAVPRNAALAAATGELVAFQDSDDLWAKDKLLAQIPIFDNPEIVLSFANCEIMDSAGKKTGKTVVGDSELKDGENLKTLLKHNVISTLTVMARREVVDEVGRFDEDKALRAVEDYHLWLRILAKYPKGLKHIAKTLAYYRMHDQNVSTADGLVPIERLLNVFNSFWEFDALTLAQRRQLESALQTMHENWGRMHDIMHPEQKPVVSVVMSVYNGADHLKNSINGILGQTFKDFEFIIIDDGSSDNSAAIVRKIKDSRIRLIRQTNHGLVYSLNKGIQLARGTYIARQDADDISLPKRFSKEVELLDSDPKLGLVGTFFTYIDETTNKPGLTICMPTKSLDIKRALYITNPIGHGTAMMRREVFGGISPYTDAYGPTEDFELWRRIADYWDMAIIPESLYSYLINTKSISHTKGDEQHANTAAIIAEQWAKPFFAKSTRAIIRDGNYYKAMPSKYASLIFDQYAAHQIDIGKALLHRGTLRKGIPTAYAAIRLKPKSYYLFIKPLLHGTMVRLGVK